MRQLIEGRALQMEHPADSGGNVVAVKIAGIWAMWGITSWSEAASCAAFIFTMYLLFHHIFRDIVRPVLESLGWLKHRKVQRHSTMEELERGE
jgi:hypothetical protein